MSMPPADRRELQRIRYWQGQTLRSRDFRDQLGLDARRRRLHNRALHGGLGISFGLGVIKKTSSPLVLTVACGLAYDGAGRELVLQRPRDVTAPAQSAWLVLRWRSEERTSSSSCPPPDPGCILDGALDLERDAELAWHPEGSLDPVNGVVLARVTSMGHDTSFRPRLARPLARPRLARGETVRGNTPWERWEIDEPDGQGGLRKKAIGVQTFIDTAAAGFTATPCYFATLGSPEWNLQATEFAPAFFPQVADPTVDGFTFRLLMVETARRRYDATFATGRVSGISRGLGDRLEVAVGDAVAAFRKGDVVALLRPRAESAILIAAQSGLDLTLRALLADAEANKTVLAVGHGPRVATVTDVAPENPAVLVTFTSAAPRPKKNDVIVRFADKAVAVVSLGGASVFRVGQPFPSWVKTDGVGFASVGSAIGVESASGAPDGSKTSIVLDAANHNLAVGESVVLLDDGKMPLAVATVVHVQDETIDVQPAADPVTLAEMKHAALVRKDITVTNVQLQSPGSIVTVAGPGVFREGDFVAAVDDTSRITVIDKISGAKLSLRASIPLTPDVSRLVVANWLGATFVTQSATTGGSATVNVGRAEAVPPSSFVVRVDADGFSAPSIITAVSGASITMDPMIPDLARLETLAIGVFPRIVTVLGQERPDQVEIAETGALAPGDTLIRMADPGGGATPLVRVRSAGGSIVDLVTPLAGLSPGELLGVVHFGDAVLVKTLTADPMKITVDRDIDRRDGDFVAAVTHYADNSGAGLIQEINGQTLTLTPGATGGDGIVPAGWIDGGILGLAAVSFPTAFPPWTRMDTTDGLEQWRPATAYGLDLVTGQFRASSVYVYLVDAMIGRVLIWPLDLSAHYRLRPESLSIVTTFNTDFPSAFATFAQKQGLSVRWIGCQQEFPRPTGCPGAVPVSDPCAVAASPEE
jgi:hypothetical protein